jgi:hypothetical protein
MGAPCLGWCLIADAGMQTLPAVEDFDVIKHGCFGFVARAEAELTDVFLLQRSKESFLSARCRGNSPDGS